MHQMRHVLPSRIMTRTTVDIDAAVMRELKRRQKREGKTLGRLVSELLATALGQPEAEPLSEFTWTARSMGALVDLEDKEALRRALDVS
jgi:Arc/MetJ family transcription regulator